MLYDGTIYERNVLMVKKIDRRLSEKDGNSEQKKSWRNNDKYVVCLVFISKCGEYQGEGQDGFSENNELDWNSEIVLEWLRFR